MSNGVGGFFDSFVKATGEFVDHVNDKHVARKKNLNREFCLLTSGSVIAFALLLIGILGATQTIPMGVGGFASLITIGATGIFAIFIAICVHCSKRAAYQNDVKSGATILEDTVSYFDRK